MSVGTTQFSDLIYVYPVQLILHALFLIVSILRPTGCKYICISRYILELPIFRFFGSISFSLYIFSVVLMQDYVPMFMFTTYSIGEIKFWNGTYPNVDNPAFYECLPSDHQDCVSIFWFAEVPFIQKLTSISGTIIFCWLLQSIIHYFSK